MLVSEGSLTATVCFEWSGFAKGQSFVVGEVGPHIHKYIHTYNIHTHIYSASQFTGSKPAPMVSDWSLQNRDGIVCMYVCM